MIDQQRLRDEAYRWEVIAALIRDHGDAIMRFCVARLGEGVAEEVTQEVFVAAWDALQRYRPEVSLQAWLFGIARNKCRQTYRNHARRHAIDEEQLEAIQERAHAQEPRSPEDALADATLHGQLHENLRKLPSEDRIVLTLWYWKELPVAEIADLMGKTEAAIRKRLTRAQQRLKELMHATVEPS